MASESIVSGTFIGHSEQRGFFYRYTCPVCGKTFRSVAPTLSVPSLCHGCYAGLEKQQTLRRTQQDRRNRRKAGKV